MPKNFKPQNAKNVYMSKSLTKGEQLKESMPSKKKEVNNRGWYQPKDISIRNKLRNL